MKDAPVHLRLPRGIDALGPEAAAVHRELEADWIRHASLFGHRAVHVPPVGFADTFTHGHEAAGDRTYVFPDRAGRALALVSDSGAAVLRLALESPGVEQRLSFNCPIFRYWRRPHRYLHHLGATTYVPQRPGSDGAAHRVEEQLRMIASFLAPRVPAIVRVTDLGIRRALFAPLSAALGVPLTRLVQDHEGMDPADRAARLDAAGVGGEVRAALEAIDAVGPRGADDSELDAVAAVLPPELRDRLGRARALARAGAVSRGPIVRVDLGNVHGVEFHDGLAYEVVHESGARLGDGGDFGAYAARFAGQDVGMFSTVLVPQRIVPLVSAATPGPTVYLRVGGEARALGEALAAELRAAGHGTWVDADDDRLKRQIKGAVARGCRYVVVVGGDEVGAGRLRVRRVDGEEVDVALGSLAAWVSTDLAGG